MPDTYVQRSFAGGELAPALHSRADQAKYLTGLRTCRNFLIRREGGVSYRSGFRFVAEVKDGSSDDVALYSFKTELADEGFLIEAGTNYLRFYQDAARVLVSDVAAWSGATAYVPGDLVSSGGVNYYCILAHTNQMPPNATYWYALSGSIFEVPAPAGYNLIGEISQNGNVLTITRQDQAPLELIYSGPTSWVLQIVSTEPSIAPPTGIIGTAGVAGTRTFRYIVTAAASDTFEESDPSVAAAINSVDDPTPTDPHVLTWTAVPGAAEYYVYLDPYDNGVFGFIGTAKTNSFRDTGFVPDFSVTPPIARTLFNSANNYPNVSAVYQQRRFFASTALEPERIDASRVGFFSNFGITSPLQDDDALTFRLAGQHYHVVRWIIGLRQLLVGTDGGIWTVGQPKTPLTPAAIPAEQETYAGVHDKPPVVIGNTLVYIEARGVRVRDLTFNESYQGYAGRDLTMFASHLFDGFSVSRMAFQNVPHSIVWVVRGDGTLLGLTYIPEQEIWGWHRHDTAASGAFEHVAVVPEDVEDSLYVVVRRTIGGTVTRYIERMEPLSVFTLATDAFFLDSALRYSGAAATNITGLDHLEGEEVWALADGAVQGPFTVSGGAITLTTAAAEVVVGLLYEGDVETLDLDLAGSSVRDRKKRIAAISLLLENSLRVFQAGPDSSHLRTFQVEPYEPAAGTLFTGQVEMHPVSHFTKEGRVFIRHAKPVPLTITGIMPNVEVGG